MRRRPFGSMRHVILHLWFTGEHNGIQIFIKDANQKPAGPQFPPAGRLTCTTCKNGIWIWWTSFSEFYILFSHTANLLISPAAGERRPVDPIWREANYAGVTSGCEAAANIIWAPHLWLRSFLLCQIYEYHIFFCAYVPAAFQSSEQSGHDFTETCKEKFFIFRLALRNKPPSVPSGQSLKWSVWDVYLRCPIKAKHRFPPAHQCSRGSSNRLFL